MKKVDTLIIGSGVVATALTKRLLEHKPNTTILILEAGKRIKTKDFGIWEGFQVTGAYPFQQIYDDNYPERDKPGENRLIGESTRMRCVVSPSTSSASLSIVWAMTSPSSTATHERSGR